MEPVSVREACIALRNRAAPAVYDRLLWQEEEVQRDAAVDILRELQYVEDHMELAQGHCSHITQMRWGEIRRCMRRDYAARYLRVLRQRRRDATREMHAVAVIMGTAYRRMQFRLAQMDAIRDRWDGNARIILAGNSIERIRVEEARTQFRELLRKGRGGR